MIKFIVFIFALLAFAGGNYIAGIFSLFIWIFIPYKNKDGAGL